MPTVQYKILPGDEGKPVKLPLVKVQLNYKKSHKITPVPISALIDSGADVCFCKEMIGTWLGIKFDKIKKSKSFTTANKTRFNAKCETVMLHAYGKQYETKFYFTDDIPDHTPIILGQIGFFDHFKITFDYVNNEIELV